MSKLVIAADEDRPILVHLADLVRRRRHDVVVLPIAAWAVMAADAAHRVANGECDQAIVCCWTGTGAAIAANKVPGIRAALCTDAATAAGARQWNDANVLALSLRLLSEPVAEEIIDAWLKTPYGGTESESLRVLLDQERGPGTRR